jgi:anti-sigma factor RsiW
MNGEHPTHPTTEKVQRHYDGELSAQEAADVQQHLRSCAECQAELAGLERLSDMVRWSTDETAAASDVSFTQMFAEIERAVAPNVVALPQKRAASPIMRAVPVLGALALAAAALLMLTRSDTLPSDAGEQQLALLDTSQHAEITAVKFGRNAGQVFGIALSEGESVPVVWIDDADDDEEE